MNPAVKLQLKLKAAKAEDLEEDSEMLSTETYFEFEPETDQLTDAEILEDGFLEDYDDFENSELLGAEFGFIPGED